jgi:hypothetical protein
MTTDPVPMISGLPLVGVFQPGVRAALLGMSAFVRVNRPEERAFDPDRWSYEAPFLDPEWPRQ